MNIQQTIDRIRGFSEYWSDHNIMCEALIHGHEYKNVEVSEEEISSADELFKSFIKNYTDYTYNRWTLAQEAYVLEIIEAGILDRDDITKDFVVPSQEVCVRGIQQCFERQIKIKFVRFLKFVA